MISRRLWRGTARDRRRRVSQLVRDTNGFLFSVSFLFFWGGGRYVELEDVTLSRYIMSVRILARDSSWRDFASTVESRPTIAVRRRGEPFLWRDLARHEIPLAFESASKLSLSASEHNERSISLVRDLFPLMIPASSSGFCEQFRRCAASLESVSAFVYGRWRSPG